MATATELYRFVEKASGLVWTYTSGNEEVTYNGEVYEVVSINRTEAEVKNEISKANIEVDLPLSNEVAIRWMQDNGERMVSLTIFERDKGGAFNVIWKGRLASIQPGMQSATLNMESIFTSLRRPGLRSRYQLGCRHALYGRGCNLDPEDFAVPSFVTVANNRVLTIPQAAEYDNGYFVGGMLRAPDQTLSYVIGHISSVITLQRMSFSLSQAITTGLPLAVKLYPGCEHTRPVCNTKFDNLLNYGGCDFIPSTNPVAGSSIV